MLLVTYDLRQPGRDYSDLFNLLKSATSWAKIADSVWMLKTTQNCAFWRDQIQGVVDSNDLVFVIEVKQHWASLYLGTKVMAWLNDTGNW